MPLRTLLSRPATAGPHRRHSSIVEDAAQEGLPSRGRADSMKRLSLGFSRSNEETFNPFKAQESGETQSEKYSPTDALSSEHSALPKSVSTTAALTSKNNNQSAQAQNMDAEPDELPLPRPQRFSILGFRHASDPQLSTRFKQGDITPPRDPDREHPSLLKHIN